MNIYAKIKGIEYSPTICSTLKQYTIEEVKKYFPSQGSFLLNIQNKSQIAISWWVSSKRSRSYPYARIYDTISFSGKRITIIPIFKDEGYDGDRDYLQWDTISLMNLMGIYVIIAYYDDAIKNMKYANKITKQRFNTNFILSEIEKIKIFQSDAFHWNIAQAEKAGIIGEYAIKSYKWISEKLNIKFHSFDAAKRRIEELIKGKDNFLKISRELARRAQNAESQTIQPKEVLNGTKSSITIENYLGGLYYLTVDECKIENENIFLVEGKHTKGQLLSNMSDIKDGLFKMALFCNLSSITIGKKQFKHIPVLKLSSDKYSNNDSLTPKKKILLEKLEKEAELNHFKLIISNI